MRTYHRPSEVQDVPLRLISRKPKPMTVDWDFLQIALKIFGFPRQVCQQFLIRLMLMGYPTVSIKEIEGFVKEILCYHTCLLLSRRS